MFDEATHFVFLFVNLSGLPPEWTLGTHVTTAVPCAEDVWAFLARHGHPHATARGNTRAIGQSHSTSLPGFLSWPF